MDYNGERTETRIDIYPFDDIHPIDYNEEDPVPHEEDPVPQIEKYTNGTLTLAEFAKKTLSQDTSASK